MPRTDTENETETAFLVDPTGKVPETLTGREYNTIRRYLDMDDGAACDAAQFPPQLHVSSLQSI
jgi:hypothetical protein